LSVASNPKLYGRPAEDGNGEEENAEEDVDGGGEGEGLIEVELLEVK